MALIVEILDPSGSRTRQRVESLPLTLGRSCANDVILDDAYVDARHAQIVCDPSGRLVIEDLGSVNGVRVGAERYGRFVLEPGVDVRIGRTRLRVRDPEERLPPALPDALEAVPIRPPATHAPVAPLGGAHAAPRQMVDAGVFPRHPLAGALVTVAGVICLALSAWLGNYQRGSGGAVLGAVLAFLVGGALWAGIWAVASRAVVHRFQFAGHFVVAIVLLVTVIGLQTMSEWTAFLLPDRTVPALLPHVVGFVALSALLAEHLALSSTMTRRRQWRAGLAVASVVLVISGLTTLAGDDSFTDVPTFSAVLKPVPDRWLPTDSVDDFAKTMQRLKREADGLAMRR